MTNKISHVALRMRVVALANEGCTDVAIAAILGISQYTVVVFLDEAKFLRAKIKQQREPKPRLPRKQRNLAGGVEIPRWVMKAKLGQDFTDVARERGEHAAASHCRALLREMRMTEAFYQRVVS